ncbi:MAG: aspartate/glutamate racemase family protein [Casimicrobiaceae bacterium]
MPTLVDTLAATELVGSVSASHRPAVAPLGILMFETDIPPEPGDIGCPDTFPFPVRYAVVPRMAVIRVAHSIDDALLATFIHAAAGLVEQGCHGIVTTCSFLARWQSELAMSLTVPVLASSLLQVPLVQRLLPRRQRVGIVIRSAIEVDEAALQAAGVEPYGAIECVAHDRHSATTLGDDPPRQHRERMRADVVAAARRLVGAHANLGAIVLECASMSAHRDAVAAATGTPVFGALQLFTWFHASLQGTWAPYQRHLP